MIGERYNRLTVLKQVGVSSTQKKMWLCRCECGAETITSTGSLRSGNTKSCGCLNDELRTKHGMHETRVYRLWNAMLNRTRQEQHKEYYLHVTVCNEWLSFEAFYRDMGSPPAGMTLDRIKNNEGYYPGNCRWATQTQQMRNTRRRKDFEMNGERKSLIEWAESKGINFERLRGRIRRGWRFEDAITGN
jgi:hypothetical protein